MQVPQSSKPGWVLDFVRPGTSSQSEVSAMPGSFASELKRKTVCAEQAAAVVKSGDWLDYGFGVGQPDLFDQALAARITRLSDVKLRGCLALRPRAVIEADPDYRHIAYLSWYFSGLERKMHDRGR